MAEARPLRLPTLGPGAFRMLLALLVFVSHVSRFEVGRPAVFIFFILSGYWVVRLFDQDGRDPARFEINRFLRIWPLLAVTALLVVGLTAAFDLPQNGSLSSTLPLLGLASRDGDLIGVAWSLDIELQFYILVLIVSFGLRQLTTRLSYIDAALIAALFTTVGVALLSRDIWTVAAFAPTFAAGAAIYFGRWHATRRTAMLSVATFGAVGLVFAVVPDFQPLLLKYRSEWWRDLVHMAWCLLLTPFIAYNVRQKSTPLDRHLGNLSFPFYLVHPVVIVVVAAQELPYRMLGHAAAFGTALLLSVALYLAVDRPLEHVRRRLIRIPGRRLTPDLVKTEELATM